MFFIHLSPATISLISSFVYRVFPATWILRILNTLKNKAPARPTPSTTPVRNPYFSVFLLFSVFFLSHISFSTIILAPSSRSVSGNRSYPRSISSVCRIVENPSAASAADTSAAPPRRSWETTSAPCRRLFSAVSHFPQICSVPPIFCSSSAVRRRSSNTFSQIQLFPSSVIAAARYSDCRSVGKPGYSSVSTYGTACCTFLLSATSVPLFLVYCPPIF